MLKPLQQWMCDKCSGLIEKPADGWFEWLSGHQPDGSNIGAHSFKIVHNAMSSTRGRAGCFHHDDEYDRSDNDLDHWVGPAGMIALLSMLDVGPIIDRHQSWAGPRVKNIREFTECFRRLMLPHYEEARLLFRAADADGFFDGANEILVYLPDTLKTIIQRSG